MRTLSAPHATLLVVLAAACAPAEPPGMDDPSILRFDLASYSVQPGQEITYNCYTMRTPADRETVVTEIAPLYGQAVHHIAIYYTLLPERDGAFHCPELVKDSWVPLFVAGIESGSLKVPPGAGFRLRPGTQILVQLHLQNVSARPVMDRTAVLFRTQDPAVPIVPAGIFGMDYRQIHIPARQKGVQVGMSCQMERDLDVFAVMGHMHKHGRRIEVSRGGKPGDDVLYQAEWVFEEQPTTPLVLKIRKTDHIHLRCWYDNDSDKPLPYGESSDQEMCSFVFYHTPSPAGVGGCIG